MLLRHRSPWRTQGTKGSAVKAVSADVFSVGHEMHKAGRIGLTAVLQGTAVIVPSGEPDNRQILLSGELLNHFPEQRCVIQQVCQQILPARFEDPGDLRGVNRIRQCGKPFIGTQEESRIQNNLGLPAGDPLDHGR